MSLIISLTLLVIGAALGYFIIPNGQSGSVNWPVLTVVAIYCLLGLGVYLYGYHVYAHNGIESGTMLSGLIMIFSPFAAPLAMIIKK